jgi:hypothetical protein
MMRNGTSTCSTLPREVNRGEGAATQQKHLDVRARFPDDSGDSHGPGSEYDRFDHPSMSNTTIIIHSTRSLQANNHNTAYQDR